MKLLAPVTKSFLLLLCVTFILSACKRENLPKTVSLSQKSWDQTARTVAIDVSKKLNSLSFRKMLKHEVLLRFDGDANILLSSLVKRLPKYLAYEAARGNATRTGSEDLLNIYDFDILTEAAADYPQMQLAVQTDAESWDPSTFTPAVVYLPSDYDEITTLTIPGFDQFQNPISVDATGEPAVNYVVVSQNERTVFRDDEVLRFIASNCPVEPMVFQSSYDPEVPTLMLPPDDGCEGSGGGGTGGGGGGGSGWQHPQYRGTGQDGILPTLIGAQAGTVVSSPANGAFSKLQPIGVLNGEIVYRKNFRHEKMRQIRCDDIGQIEGWPAGAPEIRVHVFEQNVLNPSENLQIFKEQFEPSRRKDIKDKWWNAGDVTMHLWDYVSTGTKTSFGYYEYDPVLIPNEVLASIGEIIVDLLIITSIDSTTTPNFMTIYGSIRQTVGTGIRSMKRKNGMSEYIGKDDYSIFNDEDHFNHSKGGTKFYTSPDL